MGHKRIIAWVAVLILTGLVLASFYIATRPPQTSNDSEEDQTILSEPVITYIDPSRGPTDATITIVEYTDFTCSACQEMAESILYIQQLLPNDVRHIYKAVPNDGANEMATPAAVASYCAGNQGKFWEYHDLLYANQNQISRNFFYSLADYLELDREAFSECYENNETLPLVQRTYEEALRLNLVATPTIFINEFSYTGSMTTTELELRVRELLLELTRYEE